MLQANSKDKITLTAVDDNNDAADVEARVTETRKSKTVRNRRGEIPTEQRVGTAIGRRESLLLRLTLGIVFIWFGALKPLDISPAHELIALSIHWFPGDVFVPVLGLLEVLIGVGLLIPKLLRLALAGMLLHLVCTFIPCLTVPELCFTSFPYGLTLVGQYIVKNLVFIAVGLILGIGLIRSSA